MKFSFDSGYVLGALLGDGSLDEHHTTSKSHGYRSHHYRIMLRVTDREFGKAFAGSLHRLTGKKPHEYVRPQNSDIGSLPLFCTVMNSKVWYKELRAQVELARRGSIMDDSIRFLKGLVRGFYDSEGSLSVRRYKDRTCFNIQLINAEWSVVQLIHRIVKVLGFSRFKVYAKRRDGFRTLAVLTCQTRHEVERFVSDIGSAIPRKCTIKL